MIKKLISAAAGAGLVLTMAGSAFATGWWMPQPKVEVNNMGTTIVTKGVNVANTGAVAVMAGTHQERSGNATAVISVDNAVNGTRIGTCGLCGPRSVEVNNMGTTVVTKGLNVANTGAVAFRGHTHQDSSGNATASFVVVNAVNQTVVGVE